MIDMILVEEEISRSALILWFGRVSSMADAIEIGGYSSHIISSFEIRHIR